MEADERSERQQPTAPRWQPGVVLDIRGPAAILTRPETGTLITLDRPVTFGSSAIMSVPEVPVGGTHHDAVVSAG